MSIGLLALLTACGGGGGGSSQPTPPPAADTTPDAFAFTAQTGTLPSAVASSNEVTITGIDAATPVTITGGEYSINGAGFTSAAGTVTNNQRIQVRLTSSSQFTTAASSTLTVGGMAGTFTATTRAADTTPDAFAFTAQNGANPSAVASSNEVTITGINTGSAVSITGGEYSINGGAFTSAAGMVTDSQRIKVRLTSSSQFTTAASSTLTIGGVAGTFTATTRAADTTPDAIKFRRKADVSRDTWVSSASATVTGIEVAVPVAVENGEYSINGGAYTAAAGAVTSGQTLTLRVRAGAAYSKNTMVRVTVGSMSEQFEVTAELPAYLPDSVSFDGTDVVYLLSSANRAVFRWSIGASHYLDAVSVGDANVAPVKMTYSAPQQRLYLGYDSGAIRTIDMAGTSRAENAFATAPGAITLLTTAGNFIIANGPASYVYNAGGTVTATGWSYSGYSTEHVFDAVTSRIYHFRDGYSPNDLHYEVLNQTTGVVTGGGETPYHGAYSITPPIRVSANGQSVLLGSGDIYNQDGLTWAGSVGGTFTDARWFANESLVTLTTASGQTNLRRLGAGNRLTTLEQVTYTGNALRIIGTDAKMAVLLTVNGGLQIRDYVPNDDGDDDGVSNTQDAFPLDRAASVDTDRDGYPDAWNAGRTAADSTTGLALDAFPRDSACWLSAHGAGGVCNYGATMPNYVPDQVTQDGDTLYLLSTANRRVYRWSISGAAYLNPYVVGIDQGYSTLSPTKMAYSPAHHRLYLGYSTGAIRSIDVTATSVNEVPFANTALGINGLAAVGNYLLAQDFSGAWATHYVFSGTGAITDQREWNYYSREYAWDPVSSRVYFFRDATSPNDLHFEVIDQNTGRITANGETIYHGAYEIRPPIRPSLNGMFVLLGSGDIYNRGDLNNTQFGQYPITWAGALGGAVADARWLANGQLVTLTTAGNQTTLRRLNNTNLVTLEQSTFPGEALRVVGTDARMVVLVVSGGTVQFRTYVPNDDGDGDGVTNTQDAYPLDPAASVDTDHDGYPNAWNSTCGPGHNVACTAADSTTGLTLDAFPNDAACWLSTHGSGGVCNYGATIPVFVPDQIAQRGDVIYLLSSANKRVYRWSISGAAYLNPYVVGTNQGFTVVAPVKMTYSSSHQRLYLGYGTGAIRYIDVGGGGTAEQPFANASTGITSLTTAGNFLLATADTSYIFDQNAVITGQGWSYYSSSSDYAWDPINSRLYFFRDGISPNDLQYVVINQTTGVVTSSGETPYHGAYDIQPPIRVSVNGQYVLLGSGDLYNQSRLTWAGSLGSAVNEGRWFADGSLLTLRASGNQTLLRRVSATNLATLEQKVVTGAVLRVFGSDTSMVLVLNDNGTLRFQTYVPSNDSDGDGAANTADAFPLDAAASVDTDHDGYPNAWNSTCGSSHNVACTAADSTTGLTLDAFPNDAACWLSAHGSGGVCNYGATIPAFVPDQIAQRGDVIYLLSSANKRVYRWSISGAAYLNPFVVGIDQGFSTVAPVKMTYSSSHQRLYLGYGTGAIRYIDLGAGGTAEQPFASASTGITSLTTAGNFLLATADTSYIFDQSAVIKAQGWAYYSYSGEYAWDAVNSRLYYFRDGVSPNDLQYVVINQTTGLVTLSGETPYHGSYDILPPIRVSVNGQYVLLGSGDLYNQSGLTWAGSLGTNVNEARWFADGSLLTLRTNGNQTLLRRVGANNLTTLEQKVVTGAVLRVFGSDTSMVLVLNNNGTVRFETYAPSNDSDGDGAANTADAFPLDAAASVDTDHDGYPNAWNNTCGPGHNAACTVADSTTGLTLDAFPNDAACWLSAHGSGGVCNYGATVPNYIPTKVETAGNVIYLLSPENRRVYRWSMTTGQYLNPYVVGISQGSTTLAPTHMTYSPAHQRLYFGYATGAIRSIDVSVGNPVETPFVNVAMAVGGLASVGNYVLAQDQSGAWATHYVISGAGVITSQAEWNHQSDDYAWDPVSSRVYFFSMWSPRDLNYEEINQTTGVISSPGESPYHDSSGWTVPIRVSADGNYVLVGSGRFHHRNGLATAGSLGVNIADARWGADTLVDVTTGNEVQIRDAGTRAVLKSYQYNGTPLRLAYGTTEVYLVHVEAGASTTSFMRLPFNDGDADGMPRWWEDLYLFNDGIATDANADADSDGVTNRNEYVNHTLPRVADTDGDGLTDSQEIVTYGTSPTRADTDGDGLNDQAEVVTHHTDPLRTDSDNDTYTDFDEVQYGGNPNNASVVPQGISTYTQTFEGSPNLAAWSTPPLSGAPWSLDATAANAHGGSKSYVSGSVLGGQTTSTRFRGVFRAGQMTFWARVDYGSSGCCNYLQVYVDDTAVQTISASYPASPWGSYTIAVPAGAHNIEWRFAIDPYYGGSGSVMARIDDVVFTAN